ncbi:MAG: hypothetical protein M3336_15165 [Chloroflexota bacterium]|nr:hypothetical protein [Chloroflexota bacterium]
MTELRVEFDAATDPLYRDVALRHTTELPVLGISVRFETNSATVLGAVEESFGRWRSLASHHDLLSPERVRIRLIVQAGDERTTGRVRLTYRVPDSERLLIQSPGSMAVTELSLREGLAYVTPQLVADRAHFRYSIVEALTLNLVTKLDRAPVHAAAAARNGVALLLAGASGTGKSTLTYAAACAGLQTLSDDVVFIQLTPRPRVWGMPGRVHLLPSAREHFPQLASIPVSVLASGKEKMLIDLGDPAETWSSPVAERAGICLLQRVDGPVSLESLPSTDIRAMLLAGLEGGFDCFRDTIEARLAALSNGSGWRLNLSGNPTDAVPYLQVMLDELEARG